MAIYSASDVAIYMIRLANSDSFSDGMTNLKLQKILYFVQAASLVTNDKMFISDDFEAWDYWPVIPSVYRTYETYGRDSIPDPEIDLENDAIFQESDFLDRVWKMFGKYSARELVRMSHEYWPRNRYYNKLRTTAPQVIPPEEIKTWFDKLIYL